MSFDALVFWMFAVAWLVVLGLIVFVAIPQAVREGLRIARRVLALVNESPLPLQLAKARSDAVRLRIALERLPALAGRAAAVIALVRATPLVSPTIIDALAQVRREIGAIRALGRP